MSRKTIALLFLLSPTAFAQTTPSTPAQPSAAGSATQLAITGTVADSSGAIIPGAEVDLTDASGATIGKTTTDASGSFRINGPHAGSYSVIVSLNGFQPATKTVTVGATSAAAPLAFTMQVAEAVQQVTVNAGSQIDLTASDSNSNTTVMSAKDMKDLPIFDNDYVTAMSAFLDGGASGTSGSGLMVDGMEANRALVSPSAVQEVRINQDPYSAQYFWPGRGQIDIITKQAADAYHGEFNFTFRDSAMNAQQDFSSSKPYEQRQMYEGSFTGPVAHSKSTMFLFSLNRNVEDLTSVVNATIAPTAANPEGIYDVNVPAPTTDTEFSFKIGHQFSDRHSESIMYSFQNAYATNVGVGNQTLPEAGYDTQTREDDLTMHDNYVVSGSMLNEASLALERSYDPVKDVQDGPMLVVSGNYTGGSAQADQLNTEYNLRANEMLTWTMGPHTLKFGVNIPHFGRRVRDDETNEDGTYTFSPTYAADGSVEATAIQNEQAGIPSGFSMANGQTRFVYHQQEVGGFVQDQIKLKPWFSVTPGLRYDWQTFPGDTNNFSPRVSFAWVWDQKQEMVLRGGAGVYFDRSGSGPLIDLARYQDAKRRLVELSSNQETLCYPITSCVDTATLPASYVELEKGIRTPYDTEYGLTLERKAGEKGTVSIGGRISRWTGLYRSIDENAPLGPDYTTRPDPNVAQLRQIQSEGKQYGSALDINYRGRFNKRFTGFAWYTLANSGNNTDGISWFPENQRDPGAEWGPSSWEQRNKFGLYGSINPQHLLNLGVGVFANSGKPWSVLTGTDAYGTDLFNARPDGVARNSEIGPDYADVDLRWGYDFKLQPKETDKSPTLGFSVSSFDVLNHPNGSYVDTTEGSTDFGQVTSAYAPRRTQLAMRFQF